ncbi:uncharacterized protein LOC144436509 [Glandiceps talaboti]
MVSLQDLALKSLTDHLPILCDLVGETLPTRLKEVVLQRLSERDMITKEYVPVINKCLFVPELKCVNLFTRPEVTDEVLKCLAETQCRLRSLHIGNSTRFPYMKSKLNCSKAKREKLLKRLLEKQRDLDVLEIQFIDMKSCNFLTEIKSRNLVEFMIRVNTPMLSDSFTKGMESVAQNNSSLKNLAIKYLNSKDSKPIFFPERALAVKWNEAIINTVKYIGANLKMFVVDGQVGLLQDTFGYIARYCPNLVSFILQCDDIWCADPWQTVPFHSSYIMLPFQENCQQLQNLVILPFNLDQTEDDPDILYLPRNMRTFKLMPRTASYSSTQRSFNISHIPLGLQELCIPVHLFEVESALAVFTHLGPRLRSLDFPCIGLIPNPDLEQTVMSCIVDHCINLSSLGLCCFYEASLDQLQGMFKDKNRSNMILRLNLMSNININPSCESNHNPHIKDFEMVKTWLIDIVKSCLMLREFATNTCYIDNRLLRSIALNCPHFTKIQIDGGCGHNKDTISDEGLCELAVNCPLEELHLLGVPFTRITNNGLLVLGMSCPYLQVLTIFHVDPATLEPALRRIHQSRGIKIENLKLNYYGCSFSRLSVTYYRPLPQFDDLRLMIFQDASL